MSKKLQTKNYMKKHRARTQHEAINKARRKIPKTYVLKVRSASKAKKAGTYWVIGMLEPRARKSKLSG